MEQDCLMLFNNVKNSKDSSTIREAFGHAEDSFVAYEDAADIIKVFPQYMTKQDIRKIVHQVIDEGYDIYIYAVFDKQSLKDGSVVVYYKGLNKGLVHAKSFKKSIRSVPGAVGSINVNLMEANASWEDFEDSANLTSNKIYS